MFRIIAAFLWGMLICAPAYAAPQEIMINGSTTVLPVIQKVGEAFMNANPEIVLAISGGGSGNGLKALGEGLCQVAMSSRGIKESERTDAAARGIKPYRITIAMDALVPVVHPDNPVNKLSVEQLREIYAGKISNWKDLGGNDERIVIISRDSSSGTFETWEEIIMNKGRVTPRALLQTSCGAVVQAVSKNENAIGYIGFGYLNDSLKAVDVNGVHASAETALDGSWPISRELYLFTDGEPEGGLKKLVDFILDPLKGQKYVQEIGYIPLKK
ncbi:MAG: phosphate ABC transporter substrate-binding protein [Desulfovibrionaceae bacterium]|nr:phosphate ABC transporter substrate-binding protein [Desulfovibrionaceae bacterium]